MNQGTVERAIDGIVPVLSRYGLQIVGAILILIVGRIIAGIVGKVISRAMDRTKADPALKGFVVNLARIAVLAFAVIAALAKFGVQTASFVAVLGAAGFAIGFALQGSLGNFAAGVMILIFRPFRVGDVVEAAGHLGTVHSIGLFVTTINTPDNRRIIVPNGKLTSDVIVNINANELRRVDMIAGISYADDMSRAKKLIEDLLAKHPNILKDPAPTVAVSELADSAVNFVVRPWVHPDNYWTVWFEVTQGIKEAFDANGISIPFPQRDVHLFQEAAS